MSTPMDTSPRPTENVIAQVKDSSPDLWESSASAKEIQALGQVEVDIVNLLQLASSSMKMLALPRPEEPLPEEGDAHPRLHGALTVRENAAVGEERAELFVDRAGQYFDTLDAIQYTLRKALYHLRQRKISPLSIKAPSNDFVPPTLGIGPSKNPNEGEEGASADWEKQGLQESRVEKEAWMGIVAGLEKMKALQESTNPSS